MAADTDGRHRRSIRLPGYNYASAGAYFVTIVTKQRECLFTDDAMQTIVDESWRWVGEQYDHVELDYYVVMPNHLHAILSISEPRRGGSRTAPTEPQGALKPLGRLIGAFKTVSTQRVNALRNTPGAPVWQRDFFDRIIRNEAELNRIRQYILDNPANWNLDPENPVATLESAAAALFPC